MRAEAARLYLITPDEPDTARLLERVGAALGAGAHLLQYRNKKADPALRLEQARGLQALCRAQGVPLIINDHLDLALAIGADGLHLGADDGDLPSARRQLGPHRWLGASCYRSLDLAQTALQTGASYVAFGAIYPSTTKPQAPTASLQILEEARVLPCPVCAIGGINAERAVPTLQAGADWLAVIGAVFDAPDPGAATRALLAAMAQRSSGSGA